MNIVNIFMDEVISVSGGCRKHNLFLDSGFRIRVSR
jgi:hypothetical protein